VVCVNDGFTDMMTMLGIATSASTIHRFMLCPSLIVCVVA
jgi:hypothetical protein